MTYLEMHIDIDQKLKKVDSGLFGSLEPDEKDWWLNEAQSRFIKQRINAKVNPVREGHQADRKRIDDIEELIADTVLPLFQTSADFGGYCVLPYNYLHPVSETVNVLWNCNGALPDSVNHLSQYVILPFPIPFGSSPFYKDFNIRVGTDGSVIDIFNPTVFTKYAAGVTDADEYFLVLNYILSVINNDSHVFTVYWEHYKDITANNSFIIVNNDQAVTLQTAEYGSTSGGIYTSFNAVDDNAVVYAANDNVVSLKSELRVLNGENLRRQLQHPFMKSSYDSPVGAYRDGKIYVYANSTFRGKDLHLYYYRKPKYISSFLKQNCELNANFHSEIVDIAVQLLSAHLGNPNHQLIAANNMTHE